MSITTTTVGVSSRTVKKQPGIVSLLLATLLALGSVLGVSTAANAASPTAWVETSTVQSGSYQTFFASGMEPGTNMLRAALWKVGGTSQISNVQYNVTSAGVANADYTRIVIPAGTAPGAYELRFSSPGVSGYWKTIPITVVAPDNAAKITSVKVNAAKTKVTVVGEGFRREDTAYNSVIGVKLDNGAIEHADTGTDKAPVPKPYPAAGSSPDNTWFYIGKGYITTGANGTYNGSTGYPNPEYASGDIVGGSFTVSIPISSIPAGTHKLTFLTGSLANASWQVPTGSAKPDKARAVSVNFTK